MIMVMAGRANGVSLPTRIWGRRPARARRAAAILRACRCLDVLTARSPGRQLAFGRCRTPP